MYHSAKNSNHLKKVRSIIKSGGYSTGKQNHSVKPKVAKFDPAEAIEHESTDENVIIPAKKLKNGGCAGGSEPAARLDKAARGGKAKHKGSSNVHVNVIVPQGGKQGIPVPAGAAPTGAPSVPPVAPPLPPGAAPMGMKPPGMKKGGRVNYDAGSLSGKGREEKIKNYGSKNPKGD